MIRSHLARHTGVGRDRRAVVTAGPPGAGKSTRLRESARPDFRDIDPDEVKDSLLLQAMADGIYQDLFDLVLADDRPVAPRELAALVHRESTIVADELQRQCLSNGENVVIHGTLGWSGIAAQLMGRLVEADYAHLEIVDVQVDLSECRSRALRRWWERRGGPDVLGGRFTPEAAIAELYVSDSETVCTRHARELFTLATSSEAFESVQLVTFGLDGRRRIED
ncbi:zeta toxin family protein [Gordonia alkaliphila]|uniref:UDP-N-acetylglucosamine kinase n=1 Tax=Gordonia alkaliphila TaxID=1053547 RepID=A0ABP8YXR3_9ACTN